MSKLEMIEAAKARVEQLEFGDPITNIFASDNNPRRYAYFVELKVKLGRNKYGITREDCFVRCTDRKGGFWRTDPEAIYHGHLDFEQIKELRLTVDAAEYGSEA